MADLLKIVETAMADLKSAVQEGMAAKGKNATGKTSRNIRSWAVGGVGMVEGSLEADATWRWVGNGRGPGKMPPIANIQAWINARGLTLSAYAVAAKIGRLGSLDFRRKNPNIFLEEIRAWEGTRMREVEEQAADNLMDRTEQIILRS